jgi:hypothetical protein
MGGVGQASVRPGARTPGQGWSWAGARAPRTVDSPRFCPPDSHPTQSLSSFRATLIGTAGEGTAAAVAGEANGAKPGPARTARGAARGCQNALG